AVGVEPEANDDSGMIDLRALLAAAQKTDDADVEGTPLPVTRTIPVYPFGAPAILELTRPPPSPSSPGPNEGHPLLPRSKVFLALAGLALMGIGAAAALSLAPPDAAREVVVEQGIEAVPAECAAALAPEAPTLSAGVDVSSLPDVTPAPAGDAAPDRPAASAAPATGEMDVRAPAAPQRSAKALPLPAKAQPPAAEAAAATKPASPADSCGGDLLCAMKRATGKR
ncbi:MAG: hypothetical protein ABI193_02625, partial [Minicystis sp.]